MKVPPFFPNSFQEQLPRWSCTTNHVVSHVRTFNKKSIAAQDKQKCLSLVRTI